MAPTLIRIQGRATINTPAERAVLTIDVSDEGHEKGEVSNNVVTTVNNLQNEIDELCPRLWNGDISPEAPVSFYSIASISTSVQDEYDDEDRMTEKKLHRANTGIDVTFRDFAKLGKMVVQLSAVPCVNLRGVAWKLTDEKQALLDEEVRMKALRHAVRRAEAFAQIIGRQKVTAVKIEDSGEFYPVGRAARKAGSGPAFGITAGIDFEPQIIDVSGTLEVEFHAG